MRLRHRDMYTLRLDAIFILTPDISYKLKYLHLNHLNHSLLRSFAYVCSEIHFKNLDTTMLYLRLLHLLVKHIKKFSTR